MSTFTTPVATSRTRTPRASTDATAPPDGMDGRAPTAQPDAGADLDRAHGDPTPHLAASLRAALLERGRAARRRLELHRVPRAGHHLHERLLRRQLVRDG